MNNGGKVATKAKLLFAWGTIISVVAGVVSYFVAKNLNDAFQIAVTGEVLVALLALYIRFLEIENMVSSGIATMGSVGERVHKVISQCLAVSKAVEEVKRRNDPIIQSIFDRLVARLWELAQGRYELDTLEDVYRDDEASISQLRQGQFLRSTCPIDPVKPEDQLRHALFRLSTSAHVAAVGRGVTVKRIFILPRREVATRPAVKEHLIGLSEEGINVRAAFSDEDSYKSIALGDQDVLVFDNWKVSTGVIDVGGWKIKGAKVSVDNSLAEEKARSYDQLFDICEDISSLYPDAGISKRK